ncbi:MAG: response regulator transcription factor [Candidatus Kaistia colombiensis]|nr:MAG: response regulator transcription factor [Kaistia sp.]
MCRIVIADDHGLYRRGLRDALVATIPDAETFEAQNFDTAVFLLEEKTPVDLAILDLHMPGLMTPEVLVDVLPIYPDTRFAIISGSETKSAILATLSAGLHGFIAKSQSDEEVAHAVKEILAGRIYVPALLSQASERSRMQPAVMPDGLRNGRSIGIGSLEGLTQRQRDVLKLMAEGYSNKEIARDLQIAEATTKIHAAAVMRRLGVRNRTEAAVMLKTLLTKKSN